MSHPRLIPPIGPAGALVLIALTIWSMTQQRADATILPPEPIGWDTLWPEVVLPIEGAAEPGPTQVVFEPITPLPQWRFIRKVERWDNAVPGLELFVGPCSEHPRAHCVKVESGNYAPSNTVPLYGGAVMSQPFLGLFVPGDGDHIYLNEYLDPDAGRGQVSCHEIGHALGLSHHANSPGCLVLGGRVFTLNNPGRGEIEALKEVYAP